MCAEWNVSPESLEIQALANLSRRAGKLGPADLLSVRSDEGYLINAIQPPGAWGSTLLLVPEELERIFGSHPRSSSPRCGRS